MSELEALTNWVDNHPDKPRLHVNGSDYSTAILTVDFGQPLSGVFISNDRGNELSSLMKAAARTVGRRKNVRVNFDNQHGIFWASAVV